MLSNQSILLVDDESRFRRSLARVLRGHDYDVTEAATGNEALEEFKTLKPDVVLLDLMLPDVDGLTVCSEMRRESSVAAIIVLSVVGDERTKIRALDEGADDYLAKPFDAEELLARIRAVLRRAGVRAEAPGVFEFDSLKIDLENHLVTVGDKEVRLTPMEFSLLVLFANNPGKLLRHAIILQTLWGEEGDAATLRTLVTKLRSKLGDSPARPRFIRTDPGLGYRFVQPPH